LALDKEELEPRDWIATVRVTDRACKKDEHQFVRSERKAEIGLLMRRIEREVGEDSDLTTNKEYGSLKDELLALDLADERVSWEDELEADQLRSEAEVEILALTHYHKTWNDGGRVKYKGEPRYRIEVLDIRQRAIQRPRLLLPGDQKHEDSHLLRP
jgi:hypothetical protein